MYAVYWYSNYVDRNKKNLLYVPNSGDDGYSVTSATLQRGINIAGELSITIPRSNPIWKYPINNGEDTIVVSTLDRGDIVSIEKDGKEIWRGRIASQSWDTYQNMSISCEGVLSYFNDFLLPAYNFYWTGVIEHSFVDILTGVYDPDEGLGSANLDKLKDFFPDLLKGVATGNVGEVITEKITDTINDVVNIGGITDQVQNITDSIGTSLDTSLDDNVDRRISVYDYLLWLIVLYNAQLSQNDIDARKKMNVGYIDPVFKGDDYKVNQKTTEYTNCWEEIQNVVLDVFGGVMYVSNWHSDDNGNDVYDPDNTYLFYYKDHVGMNFQAVQYGENLLSYDYEIDDTERISRLYVFGKTKNSDGTEVIVDMSSVNDGKTFVEVGTNLIGTVCKSEYTELTTPKECYDYAVRRLSENVWAKYKISVTAVDLNIIDPAMDAFEPGKLSRFVMDNDIFDYSQNDRLYRLDSMTLDLLVPENSEYVFSATGLTP